MDGVRGCWKLEKLAHRLYKDISHSASEQTGEGTGTVFFWGIDRSGRRIPLYLESGSSDRHVLRGTDDSGNLWDFPYTPESVVSALKENRLIPSNFTCFLILSFARGFTCIGAYFQAEYLPLIQQGFVNALLKTDDCRNIAASVTQVPMDSYLSGMLAVMVRTEDNCLIPAGPVEIIAGGGIAACDIAQIQSLTVRDAHIAGLFETVPAAVPAARLKQISPPDWKKQLAKDCFRLLDGKAVIKQL